MYKETTGMVAPLCFVMLVCAAVLGPQPEPTNLTAILLLAYLTLEFMSVELPLVGRFSAASGLLVAAAASPSVGARLAALTVLAVALIQGFSHRFSPTFLRKLFSRDLFPQAAGIVCTIPFAVAWYGGAAGALGLVVASLLIENVQVKQTPPKDRGNLTRLHTAMRPLRVASWLGGLVYLSWSGSLWWVGLLAFPLFIAIQKGAESSVYRLGLRAASVAVEESQRRQGELKRSKDHLEQKVEVLGLVVKCCRRLAGDLELQEVYRRLEGVLKEAVPHDAGAVLELRGSQLEPTHVWSSARLSPRKDALVTVGEAVLKAQGPLEVEDGSRTSYPAPFEGVRSMLGFPLAREGQPVGVVLLVHREPSRFNAERRQLLGILAVQMGITLDNTKLYGQVLQAKEQLQESQDQIVQAEKMTAVGRLAAGVAHELNSPLAAILLSLEAIEDLYEVAPEEIPPIVSEATGAIEKSQTIVNQLLQYVRKDDSRVVLDLSILAGEAVQFLKRFLDHGKFEVRFESGGQLPVLADRTKVHQILNNLILNACDASQETRRLKVSTFEDGPNCAVSVEDWGPGVPESIASKIFDPFFTTKDVGEGTGLGLTVAAQLSQQLAGRLDFHNKPEGGALFTLRLPNRSQEIDV